MQVKPAVANGSHPMLIQEPDPQVVPKAERRRFSAEYKQLTISIWRHWEVETHDVNLATSAFDCSKYIHMSIP